MDPVVYWEFLAAAEMAGVPWSYSLSPAAIHDEDYRRCLARLYVARASGLPDTGMNGYPPERTERDLDALADFTCQPLGDFAARYRAATALVADGREDRDRPVPPV